MRQANVKLICIATLGLLLGACSDPASQRILARRSNNLRNTVDNFAGLERGRDVKMASTLNAAKVKNDQDVYNASQNPRRIGRWIEQDFQRFEERQPAYRAEINHQLGGNPENIKRTLPDMAW